MELFEAVKGHRLELGVIMAAAKAMTWINKTSLATDTGVTQLSAKEKPANN